MCICNHFVTVINLAIHVNRCAVPCRASLKNKIIQQPELESHCQCQCEQKKKILYNNVYLYQIRRSIVSDVTSFVFANKIKWRSIKCHWSSFRYLDWPTNHEMREKKKKTTNNNAIWELWIAFEHSANLRSLVLSRLTKNKKKPLNWVSNEVRLS